MDITPKTHTLEMIRQDSGSWWILACEGVDNSLDAAARNIEMMLNTDDFTIADDGIGIIKANAASIVTLGDHRELSSTALGRYGIGIKYNAIRAGNELIVDSTSVDGRLHLQADWSLVTRSNRWEIPDPLWVTLRAVGNTKTGTTIVVRKLRWKRPTERDVMRVHDELAQRFYPALAAGVSIRINNLSIPVLAEPPLSDIVDETIVLANGKGAHVHGGYLLESGGILSRVHLTYRHRVIEPASTFGCDSYSGLSRLFARVELTGPWLLSRFKDAVVDSDLSDIEQEVQRILLPILQKCHSAQMDLTVEEMATSLNEMLPPIIRAARPLRKKPKEQASKKHRRRPVRKPKPEPNIVKDSEPAANGPVRQEMTPKRKLLITFEAGLLERCGYGEVKPGAITRIELARDNPDIQEWLKLRDRSAAKRILYALAIALYEQFRETHPGQQEFDFTGESFGLRVWKTRVIQPVEIAEADGA